MTAPRIVPAAEAAALLEAATPGPWSHSADGYVWGAAPEPISCAVWNADAAITAAAPDLAASVVALHALLDEAYDIIVSQHNPAWDDWCDRVCRIDLKVAP